MTTDQSDVSVPAELLRLLKASKLSAVSTDEQVQRALAIHLFVTREVSIGRAAELAAMSYASFLDLLVSLGIPAFYYDAEDIRADTAAGEAFRRRNTAS